MTSAAVALDVTYPRSCLSTSEQPQRFDAMFVNRKRATLLRAEPLHCLQLGRSDLSAEQKLRNSLALQEKNNILRPTTSFGSEEKQLKRLKIAKQSKPQFLNKDDHGFFVQGLYHGTLEPVQRKIFMRQQLY